MSTVARKLSFGAGVTVLDQVLWCSGPRVYKSVQSVQTGLPTRIVSNDHAIPSGITIPVWFDNFKVDSKRKCFEPAKEYFAIRIDDNTLEILDLNSAEVNVNEYGVMFYIPPFDLTDFNFRAQFRRSVSSPVLLSISSEGLDPQFSVNPAGLISLELSPDETRSLIGSSKSPISGIAQVEAYNSSGQVFRPWVYEWEVTPEGTVE